MFGLGMSEITVVLVLALIFLGPKMLPELASTLGKVIREVRKATADIKNEIQLDETFRKPFEELREATMLAPEELKRRDEERAWREKWDREEKERLEREEKERLAAEAAGGLPPADDTTNVSASPTTGADATSIDLVGGGNISPPAAALNDDRTLATALPAAALPEPAPAAPPRVPTPPPPLASLFPKPPTAPPVGAVPRPGASSKSDATLMGVGVPGAPLPGVTPRAPTPPPPPPAALTGGGSGPRLPPPPTASKTIPTPSSDKKA